MPDIITAFEVLNRTPVPTILVLAGTIFIFIAVIGQFVGQIYVPEKNRIWIAIIGVLFLLAGIGMYVGPTIKESIELSRQATQTAEAKFVVVNPEKPPTNTPTPTPTATIDADPTIYDNFNNPANDGSFNQSKWEPWIIDGQIIQQDGLLIMTQDAKLDEETRISPRKYKDVILNAPTFFEAKMKIDSTKNAGWVLLGTEFGFSGASGFASCRINEEAYIYCDYVDFTSQWDIRYETENVFIDYGQFHTIRMEIDPATLTFTYYLDGQVFDSYTPTDADRFKGRAVFIPSIGVVDWGSNSTGTLVGYFDDVRIGPIE